MINLGGGVYHSIGLSVGSPATSPRESVRESEYYYTLVFQNTKSSNGSVSRRSLDRISYENAVEILRGLTAGGRERELKVVDELRLAWMAKFRTPPPAMLDTIPVHYFHELVRELIVARFDSIPDLSIKSTLSDDQKYIMISFRPSNALLNITADRLEMKIAIMSEIDPGEEYWTADPMRSSMEMYKWSKADAQEELYRMFLAGKIPSEEAQLYDIDNDREDCGMWSRRIHALRRFFSPDVAKMISSKPLGDATYLPFRNLGSVRYLYRQIDGSADSTIFRVVDKIRLTKAIIDFEFDCDALIENKLLVHHFCVHTHHTDAVDTSIDVLKVQWGSLMSPIYLYNQGLVTLAQFLYYQPILHIRNYFGEELAMYFAYTSFYARGLQLLCGIAIVFKLFQVSWLSTLPSSYFTIAFALLNTSFIQVFLRKWLLQEREHAARWGVGTSTSSTNTNVRPQFRGRPALSSITHNMETYYDPQHRMFQRTASALLLSLVCGILLTFDYVFIVKSTAFNKLALSSSSNLLIAHVAVASLSKLLTFPLALLCKRMTNWENYKTQVDYDVNLTIKFALVQSVNLFGVLWLLTFVRPFLHPKDTTCGGNSVRLNCQDQAAHLLTTILAIDLILSIVELRSSVFDTLKGCLPASLTTKTNKMYANNSNKHVSEDHRQLLFVSDIVRTLDDEFNLEPYEGVLFDYAQVIITFGFVAWFAALAPLATLLGWGIAVLQIRVDSYKLCQLIQRPFPHQASSIGSWRVYLQFLSLGSWLHNAMLSVILLTVNDSHSATTPLTPLNVLHDILLFRTDNLGESVVAATLLVDVEKRVLLVFCGFGLVSLLSSIYDQRDRSMLRHLDFLDRRQRFLENKYLYHADNIADSIREMLPIGQVFLNGVHLYVVSGNKSEEDAAEEILDELVQLQLRSLQLQKQIAEFREKQAPVGLVIVELGSINILPVMDALSKSVDSFIQLQLKSNYVEKNRSKAKKDKPVNTSVVKKKRSPEWSETFELPLQALDDVLQLRVYDWELLGKNRRIGIALLNVADVATITLPMDLDDNPSFTSINVPTPSAPPMSPTTPPQLNIASAGSGTTESTPADRAIGNSNRSVSPSSHSLQSITSTPNAVDASVRLATFEVVIDVPEVLLSGMHNDLIKYGHPEISLRCGLQLDTLGHCLYQQQKLQTKIQQLKNKEAHFFEWKT